MYKALVDTNIFVDFMFRRMPFYENSEKIIDLCEKSKVKGYITTSTLMDLHYIFRKLSHSNNDADNAIQEILHVFNVIEINEKDIYDSTITHHKDFEDSVIESSAVRNKLGYIITRNIKDFSKDRIEILTPTQFIELLNV